LERIVRNRKSPIFNHHCLRQLYGDVLAVFLGDFEQIARLEVHHAGNEDVG
jgi:hypothetical protein